jgi:hypothetical protein
MRAEKEVLLCGWFGFRGARRPVGAHLALAGPNTRIAGPFLSCHDAALQTIAVLGVRPAGGVISYVAACTRKTGRRQDEKNSSAHFYWMIIALGSTAS